jgi:hypothetical protein
MLGDVLGGCAHVESLARCARSDPELGFVAVREEDRLVVRLARKNRECLALGLGESDIDDGVDLRTELIAEGAPERQLPTVAVIFVAESREVPC